VKIVKVTVYRSNTSLLFTSSRRWEKGTNIEINESFFEVLLISTQVAFVKATCLVPSLIHLIYTVNYHLSHPEYDIPNDMQVLFFG